MNDNLELLTDIIDLGVDNLPPFPSTSSVPVVILGEKEYDAIQAKIADLEAQLKAGYGINWRDRYGRLHDIHVEDVRRRKEVRNFRAVNFSIAELEAALAMKTAGKLPPPKENWGSVVMSALQLAEDAIKAITNVRPHVPNEIQTRMNVYGRRNSYYARHKRLMDKFREMQKRSKG